MKNPALGDRVRVYETGGITFVGVVKALNSPNKNGAITVAVEGDETNRMVFAHPKQCRRIKASQVTRLAEALKYIWLGDWSSVSGAETPAEFAREVLNAEKIM